MYLHLSPDTMIPIKDIVAIVPYPKQKGAAILQSFDLPVREVGVSSERNWRSLVITGEAVYSLLDRGDHASPISEMFADFVALRTGVRAVRI
mgnify:CR=1 FL=1